MTFSSIAIAIVLLTTNFNTEASSVLQKGEVASSKEQLSSEQQKLQELAFKQGYISFNLEDEAVVGFMSNFYLPKNGVSIWGKTFRCSEGAFQAAKFLPFDELVDQFCNLNGQESVKLKFEMEEKGLRRPDWFDVNEEMMYQALFAKFTQNENLKSLLLATGDAYLVEHSPHDGFWGDRLDKDGNPGKNRLGALLMTLRSQLGGVGEKPAPIQYFEMLENEKK